MKRNRSDLRTENEQLRDQISLLKSHCQITETMRQIENLSEVNFENFLVRNHYRLYFSGGQIHMPIAFGAKTKSRSEGKFARQWG